MINEKNTYDILLRAAINQRRAISISKKSIMDNLKITKLEAEGYFNYLLNKGYIEEKKQYSEAMSNKDMRDYISVYLITRFGVNFVKDYESNNKPQ